VGDHVESAISGTTLRGLPNRHQIEGRALVREARTAPSTECRAPTEPHPLPIEDRGRGVSFPCEIYRIPRRTWYAKVTNEPPGLVVGEVELENGTRAVAMLADRDWLAAQAGGQDITAHGGWAAYVATR